MRNFTVFLILPLFASIFLIGCEKSPTTPTDRGTLMVSLTDAPAEFQEVNITFSEISAHIQVYRTHRYTYRPKWL